MNVVAIIQARMGSTRLPGKVLMDIAGKPMLMHVIERVSKSLTLDNIVVATSGNSEDNEIVGICQANDWRCFRGSAENVLERYYMAALEYRADIIVRVTSDCPMIDPELIDVHVKKMMARIGGVDLVTNMSRQTYPLGLAVEVIPMDVLSRMQRMSLNRYLQEHVTTLAYERPELFAIEHIMNDEDYSCLRWTVDTPDDLSHVRQYFDHFGHNHFSWKEALRCATAHPEWRQQLK